MAASALPTEHHNTQTRFLKAAAVICLSRSPTLYSKHSSLPLKVATRTHDGNTLIHDSLTQPEITIKPFPDLSVLRDRLLAQTGTEVLVSFHHYSHFGDGVRTKGGMVIREARGATNASEESRHYREESQLESIEDEFGDRKAYKERRQRRNG